jgi:glycerol-3-phosphate dehydrogenase
LQELLPVLDRDEEETWTDQEPLPGGDMADANLARFITDAHLRWPAMPPALLTHLARHYGTRMARILGAARRIEHLGTRFGDLLTQSEVEYLVRNEWARSAEDILWRRTRLGLALPASAVHDLQDAVAKLLG